jgi:hypothetical protein
LRRAFAAKFDAIDAQWPGNILQAVLATIDEVGRHLALHLPPGILRKRDASGRRDALDPRHDVDAVAKDIVAFDDDVADINANADWIGLASAPPASCSRTCFWIISIAQATASTALPNSTSMPSPA